MNEVTTGPDPSPPAWALPDEPVPVRLMNTIWADRGGVHDALVTRGDLAAWLQAVDLPARPGHGPSSSPSVLLVRRGRSGYPAERRRQAIIAEFRARGMPMHRLRPAVVRLREDLGRYPLAIRRDRRIHTRPPQPDANRLE